MYKLIPVNELVYRNIFELCVSSVPFISAQNQKFYVKNIINTAFSRKVLYNMSTGQFPFFIESNLLPNLRIGNRYKELLK